MTINSKGLALTSLLSYFLMILINILAVFLPLNGIETAEVSDRYYNLFTPAGFTFSIWSVIYTLLLLFVVSRLIFASKNDERSRAALLPYFILSCIANASWLIAWHYEQLWIGVAIMLVLLLSLLIIHRRAQLPLSWKPAGEKILLDIPFSIYLGWISVALVANVSAALVKSGFASGLNEENLAIAMVIITTLLALLLGGLKKNLFYALTISWGLFGILRARQAEGETPLLEKILVGCIGLIILVSLVSALTVNRKDRVH